MAGTTIKLMYSYRNVVSLLAGMVSRNMALVFLDVIIADPTQTEDDLAYYRLVD